MDGRGGFIGGETDEGVQEVKHGRNLTGVSRCPHCGIANPLLYRLWLSDQPLAPEGKTEFGRRWAVYQCSSCADAVLAKGVQKEHGDQGSVDEIYPNVREADEAMPERARKYLQQAYESMHAPDAAAVVAGSAVDAMLKAKEYIEGKLYDRIDQAVKDHLLTKEMGDWAHEVRLGSNRPRHADEEDPHVTPEEGVQSVECVDALAQFLFVLPARIPARSKKGLSAAAEAEEAES